MAERVGFETKQSSIAYLATVANREHPHIQWRLAMSRNLGELTEIAQQRIDCAKVAQNSYYKVYAIRWIIN
jgi:hypothetical protein